MPALTEIVEHLDALLRIADTPDAPHALNGLQVEIDDEITRIAAAVDARERSIEEAAAAGANLLLVHHGLFWSGLRPIRGANRRRIEALFAARMALYSAHIPLDTHAELGNSVLLARELDLAPSAGFARYGPIDIGVLGESDLPTATLIERADAFARRYGGAVRHSPASTARRTRRWAICTGAGASRETLLEASARQVDTLIVGEGPHWTAIDAEEAGITIIYAGHYATETLGVRALAEHVSQRFGIPWSFVHVPTGL